MLISILTVCVILSLLQSGVKSCEESEKVQLLQEHVLEMQRQMTMDRQQMQHEIDSQKAEIVSLKEKIQNVSDSVESKLSEKNNKPENEEASSYVSFTAYPTSIRDYNTDDQVLFDATLRNYGSAYFVNVSEFICPVHAYYMISVSVMTDSGSKMYARIMLDNEALVVACARDDVVLASASQTLVTYCAAGQRVWVKCTNNDNRMYSGVYSTFTATLLRVA